MPMLTEDENEKVQKLTDAKTELAFLVCMMPQIYMTVAGDDEYYLPSRVLVGTNSPSSVCF